MRLAVVGTGYAGLVTGTCLAELGHDVVCMDIDKTKIEGLKRGKLPIYEVGLEELVAKNAAVGRLTFTTRLAGLGDPQAIFFALPTPPDEDGSADLSYTLKVAEEVARHIKHYTVLVDKSTVPPGTSRLVHAAVARETNVPFDVVSNPEFLQEGTAVSGFMNPDRIIVGASSARARKVMQEIYRPLTSQGVLLLFMDEVSAEMAKYAANTFLATKVSFMNEMANLCDAVGANVDSVKQGIGTDPRIGMRFLNAGLGYAGACLPKDVLALSKVAADHGQELHILEAARSVNERQRQLFVAKISKACGVDLSGKTFAVWGLAFKPGTDDVRHAPSSYVVRELLDSGAKVVAYDPEAIHNFKRTEEGDRITYAKNAQAALHGADALVIVTEWEEFAAVDPALMARELKAKQVFDGRNMFEPADMKKQGLHYYSVGRR